MKTFLATFLSTVLTVSPAFAVPAPSTQQTRDQRSVLAVKQAPPASPQVTAAQTPSTGTQPRPANPKPPAGGNGQQPANQNQPRPPAAGQHPVQPPQSPQPPVIRISSSRYNFTTTMGHSFQINGTFQPLQPGQFIRLQGCQHRGGGCQPVDFNISTSAKGDFTISSTIAALLDSPHEELYVAVMENPMQPRVITRVRANLPTGLPRVDTPYIQRTERNVYTTATGVTWVGIHTWMRDFDPARYAVVLNWQRGPRAPQYYRPITNDPDPSIGPRGYSFSWRFGAGSPPAGMNPRERKLWVQVVDLSDLSIVPLISNTQVPLAR